MINLKKTLALTLSFALVVALALGLTLYSDRKLALEYAVALLSDYELSVRGDVEFNIVGAKLSVRVSDADLKFEDGEQVLLELGLLAATVDVSRGSLNSLAFNSLELRDVIATVIRNDDGSYNWLSRVNGESAAATPDTEKDVDWDITVGDVSISNVTVNFEGFTQYQPRSKWVSQKLSQSSGSQQLVVEQLSLQGDRSRRLITGSGHLNQFPFTIRSELGNLSGFILDSGPLEISWSSSFGALDIGAQGLLSAGDQKTDLQLSLATQSLAALSPMFAYSLPELGQIVVQGRLAENNAGHFIEDLEITTKIAALELSVNGTVAMVSQSVEADLSLLVDSSDLGQLDLGQLDLGQLDLDELDLHQSELGLTLSQSFVDTLEGLMVAWGTRIQLQNNEITLLDFDLLLANSVHRAALVFDSATVLHRELEGSELEDNDWKAIEAIVTKPQINYQFSDQLGSWKYDYNANDLSVAVSAERNVNVATSGYYKNMPVKANASWRQSGGYQLEVDLDGAKGRAEGYLRAGEFNIAANVSTTSLSPLAALISETEVVIDRGELDIAVSMAEDKAVLTKLNLVLERDDIALSIAGSAVDLLTFDDYQLHLGLSGPSLQGILDWVNASSSGIEKNLQALSDTRRFARNSDGDLMSEATPWLQNIMQLLALDDWLRDYPALNGSTVLDLNIRSKGERLSVDVARVGVESPSATVQMQATVDDSSDGLALDGYVKALLQPEAVDELATELSLETRFRRRNDGPLELTDLEFEAGSSQGKGILSLELTDGLDALTGDLSFVSLDLQPYLPAVSEASTKDGANKADPGGETASIPPLFGDVPFVLDMLPDYKIELDIEADLLDTPWISFKHVDLMLKNKGRGAKQDSDAPLFALNSVHAFIGSAPVAGSFSLSIKATVPAVDLLLRVDDLDPDLVKILKGYDLMKSGRLDFIVDVEGQGSNAQRMAASLNGRFSVVTRDAVLNGRDLAEVAPEILSEINTKINPFAKNRGRRETDLECGIIHFDIKNGMMKANKSIVLVTPEIVFGANGAIDLGAEHLRMQIVPRTRKGLGLSFQGTFAKMAVITGPLTDARVEFDPTGAIVSGSRDVAGTILYGPIYWLYLGQAQKLLASAKVCEQAIATMAPEFK